MVLHRRHTPRRATLSYSSSRILKDKTLRQYIDCATTVEELVAATAAATAASCAPATPTRAAAFAVRRHASVRDTNLFRPTSSTPTCSSTPTTTVNTPSRLWSRLKQYSTSVFSHQMATSDKRIDIVLLDGSSLSFSVKARMQGRELFDAVVAHLRLRHAESFGLAYQLEGDYFHWLDLDKKVLRQDVSRVSTLYFRIRFYYESICCLDDLLAVAFYYLSARNLLSSGFLHCSPSTFFQLVALVLQAGTGDFVDEPTTQLLVDKLSLVPASLKLTISSSEEIVQTIATQHSTLSGCSSGTALVRFMDIAQKLPVYGVHLYHVKDKTNSPTVLGICSRGILEYANGADLTGTPTYFYEWEQLENLFHRDCKFTIEFHQSRTLPSTVSLANGAQQSASRQPRVPATPSGTTGQRATTRSWATPSELVAQSIWYNAVQQHNFYLSREGNRRSCNPLPTMATIANSIDIDREVSARLLLKPVSPAIAAPVVSNGSQSSDKEQLSASNSTLQNSVEPAPAATPAAVKVPPGVDSDKLKRYCEIRIRRNQLRDTLATKRQLLRDVCMQEARLTGELPIEYPLAPGEDRPLLVPTSYTLSTRLLVQHSPSTNGIHSSKNNSSPNAIQVDTAHANIVDLESQIELHRQIVSAKLRLAQDKGQPRKIRNQRMKDYQESLNRVTLLEEKMRLAYLQQKQKLAEPSLKAPATTVPLFNRRNGAYILDENENSNGVAVTTKESSSPLSSLSSSGIGGGVSTPSVGGSAGLLSKAKSLQDCRRLSDGSASLGGSALSLHQNSIDQLATSTVSDGRAAQLAAALSVGAGNTLPLSSSTRVSSSYSSNAGSTNHPATANYDSLYNAFSHSRQTYRSFTAGGDFPGMSSPSSAGYPPSRIHSYDTVLPGNNANNRSVGSATIRGSAAIAKSIDSGFHDAAAVSSQDFLVPQACRPPLSPVLSTPRTAPSTPGSPLRCTCGTTNGPLTTPKNQQQCHRFQMGNNCAPSARGQLYSVSEHTSCVESPSRTTVAGISATPQVTKSGQACVLRKPYKSETSLNKSGNVQYPETSVNATPTTVRQQQPAFVATRAPAFTPFSPATVGSPASEVACSPALATVDDGDSPRDGAMPVRVYARSPWTAKAYVSPRRYSGPGVTNQQQQQQQGWVANDSSSSLMTPRQYTRANTVAVTDFAMHSATSSSSSLSSFAVNSQLATDFSSEMLQWYEEYQPQQQSQQQSGSTSNQQPTFV